MKIQFNVRRFIDESSPYPWVAAFQFSSEIILFGPPMLEIDLTRVVSNFYFSIPLGTRAEAWRGEARR